MTNEPYPHEHVWVPTRVIVSRRILDGSEPVRLIIHHADDTWSVLCGTVDHPDDAEAHPYSWISSRPEIARLAERLKPGWLWEREHVGGPWIKDIAED